MKFIYKTFLFIFVLFITNILFSQNLQLYSGDYDLSGAYFWVNGQATYTYKELADYTQIREGSFQFSANMQGEEFGQSYSAKFVENVLGQYKNNVKNGLWQHSLQFIRIEDNNGSIDAKMNYKMGFPHGSWSIELKDLSTGAISESMNMNFKEGTIVGAFKKVNTQNGKEMSGTCDDEGYLHGKVITKEFGEEVIREFSHGVLQLYVVRDVKTGEVKERKEADRETLAMVAKLQKLEKENPDELENMPFHLTQEVEPELYQIYEKSILDLMQPRDFPGDSSYFERSNEFMWNGFSIIDIAPQETRAQKEARLAEEAAKVAAAEKTAAEAREKAEKERAAAEAERVAETEKQQIIAEIGVFSKRAQEQEATILKTIKKKQILAAYKTVSDSYKEKIDATVEYPKKMAFYQKWLKLEDKVMALSAEKAKELEDKLKEAKNVAEMEKLLGL